MGEIVHGDSVNVLAAYSDDSVDLIMTSPPFGLVRKKDYGNVDADEYVDWFKPFAKAFHRVLKNSGSLVIDIGGAWNKGYPTRNLYYFKLLIMLCEEFGFHLAQDFYWWNPSRLPTPAEWVTPCAGCALRMPSIPYGGCRRRRGRKPETGACCNHTAPVCRSCWPRGIVPSGGLRGTK